MRIADLLAALPAEEHYGAGAGDVTSVSLRLGRGDAGRVLRRDSWAARRWPRTTLPRRWRVARRWWLVRRRPPRFPRRPDVCARRRFAPGVGHGRRHARGPAITSYGGDRRHRHRRQNDHQQHHRRPHDGRWPAHGLDEHRRLQDRREALGQQHPLHHARSARGADAAGADGRASRCNAPSSRQPPAGWRSIGFIRSPTISPSSPTSPASISRCMARSRPIGAPRRCWSEAVDPDAAQRPVRSAIPKACVLNADDSSFTYLKPFCRAPILELWHRRPGRHPRRGAAAGAGWLAVPRPPAGWQRLRGRYAAGGALQCLECAGGDWRSATCTASRRS